ncbi:MAG: C-GCAxxG-C-C family protein [Proteobacteria bacterium]|nr:C-GCAxxG-C-C family protein [Pseudomonadota bacterium]MBU4381933.1 C-GCAxxG-C-C family protein [Pseudomonadota bacterium]MBU4605527.1 C-GCAxxG-C-C family protein [Pseudomonadota bacterium]MCG2765554.1 C-GCAxxG-C-C family protein [Desulfarculaceae bacterium]
MGQEKAGRVNPEIIKAMGAYGGGVARSGRVCGILTGAVGMVASLYGTGDPTVQEDPKLKALSRSLVERFEELTAPYGGVDCRCILGFDLNDREKLTWFRTAPDSTRRRCESLICDMAVYLGQMLEDNRPWPEG